MDEDNPKELKRPAGRRLLTGPRGGLTTVAGDGQLVRKTFFLDRDAEELLRKEAFERRISEAEIIRSMLAERYHLDPD